VEMKWATPRGKKKISNSWELEPTTRLYRLTFEVREDGGGSTFESNQND